MSSALELATLFEGARERADRYRLHFYAWTEQTTAAWETFQSAERRLSAARAADRPYADGARRLREARRAEEDAWKLWRAAYAQMTTTGDAWRVARQAVRAALDALIAYHHPDPEED